MKSNTGKEDLFQRKLAQRAGVQKRLRVLVVDDEPSILELLKTALAALENYDVSIANSAENALKVIRRQEQPFDCMLLDIQMPNVNGIQLLGEIRAIPEYADTPVIMLTAMEAREYVDQAFMAGATDYVTKPFDLLELRIRMASAQRLVQEKKKAEKSVEAVSQLREELEVNQQFSFDDPIMIEGMDRFLRYAEFDNYIMQLSHGRLFNSHATAFKLQDASFFYDMTTCSDFRRVLYDVAEGIEKATRDLSCMLSYRGNGIFLAVTHGRVDPYDYPDEDRLNRIVGTLLGQRRSDAWAHVLIGERVPLRSLSKSGALTALNKAIDSVEQREAQLQQALEDNSESSAGLSRGGGTQMRRRVYERVLRELFGDEANGVSELGIGRANR